MNRAELTRLKTIDTAATEAPKRCTGLGNRRELSLPVVSAAPAPKIRKSKNGRWRATSLILVHLLIAAHVWHFYRTGRTVSPVEPSESMYTLELGHVNAGFIFFIAALASTLIFGRFFCGWGCHIVAYQDFCGWLMKKLGVKPKPFRSRLLVFVPLGVAIYMFVWPSVARLLLPHRYGGFPKLTDHLMTTDFWKTFPGPVFAVLTVITCGFAAVYFLGAKGFCTYGCPYGGFFGLLDRFSVGKILVTDACEQCGHCTATCTSNVRVHEEVKLYGMVVDPGCMKCLDCVSVCPNNALHFGLDTPNVRKSRPEISRAPVPYDFTRLEELVLAVVFLGSFLAFRGLYDGPPLLMSVGLGGVTSYLALKLFRLWRDPTVRVQNLQVKIAGKLQRSGWVFAGMTSAWLLFAVHSGLVQGSQALGEYYLERTEATEADVFPSSPAAAPRTYSAVHHAALAQCLKHFSRADRWGLTATLEVLRGLTWVHLLRGEDDLAEAFARRALAKSPSSAQLQDDVVRILLRAGRVGDAIAEIQRSFAVRTASGADHFKLAGLLVSQNRAEEAVAEYQRCLAKTPTSAEAHYNLGGLLARMGRFVEGLVHLRRADVLVPNDPQTQIELGLAYYASGRLAESVAAFERAVRLAPDDAQARFHLNAARSALSAPR